MQPPGLSPSYTIHEVVENFEALLDQTDFHYELGLLGVSRVRFYLRRKMKKELKALFIGLWRLALERSFPHDGEEIFERFLERHTADLAPKKSEAFTAKVRDYVEGLRSHGDTDFMPTAEHLTSLTGSSSETESALRLRLALHIRNVYTLIFDRLI